MIMRRIRYGLLHVGVVCTLVCITAKILDLYYPYMDLTGNIVWVQILLYLSVLILALSRK